MNTDDWIKAVPVSLPEENDDTVLSVKTLETWLQEIRNQPNWREQAKKEADYYDGNQLDDETLALMEERNLPPLITNLIKPTVDVVLGMEAKTRSDWAVKPEGGDAGDEVAEALGDALHKAEVTSRADRACSDAYAQQVKIGIGWVEVARNTDPLKPPYRCRSIHRRYMFWDWRAQEPDLSDARYLVRKQWMDIDVLKAAFPGKKAILEQCGKGWANWDVWYSQSTQLSREFDIHRGFDIEQYEWLNPARRRIMFYEVWYRKMEQGEFVRTESGSVELFNPKNPIHQELLQANGAPLAGHYMAMRVALYAGPHLLADQPTPHRHQNFPYVPFFGFREDNTGVPYGIIRAMMSPQDEVNARKSKMQWMLSARQVIADQDAVLDHTQAAEEVARPDAYIRLNSNRKPGSRFEIVEPQGLTAQQFQIMQEAKMEINQAAGVYQSMLGNDSQAKSGIAITSVVEQGTTTLGELNDNYRHSRRLVGELLLELVKEDLEGQLNNPVTIDQGREKKTIVLNQPAQDPQTGRFTLQNNVAAVRCAVVLDDVPQTPTYRNQQLTQLAELTKSLPPQLQAAVTPFLIEATDIPTRYEISDVVRKALGMDGEDGQDPEKEALKQQLAQLQEQLRQATQGPQMAQLQAQIDKLKADGDLQRMKALQIVDELAKSRMDSPVEEKAEQIAGINPNEREENEQ